MIRGQRSCVCRPPPHVSETPLHSAEKHSPRGKGVNGHLEQASEDSTTLRGGDLGADLASEKDRSFAIFMTMWPPYKEAE